MWVMFAYFRTCYAQVVHFTWNMSSIPESFDLFHPLFMISMSWPGGSSFLWCALLPLPVPGRKINTEARAQQVSKQPVP